MFKYENSEEAKLINFLKNGDLVSAEKSIQSANLNNLKNIGMTAELLGLIKTNKPESFILFMNYKNYGIIFNSFLYLRHAVVEGNIEIIKFMNEKELLLKNIYNEEHIYSSFKYACKYNRENVVEYFIKQELFPLDDVPIMLKIFLNDNLIETYNNNPICEYLFSFPEVKIILKERYQTTFNSLVKLSTQNKISKF